LECAGNQPEIPYFWVNFVSGNMKKIKDFYNKYKAYAQTDVLMYLSFFVFLALLFIFFG
jgi:hypothetical protein